MAIVDALEVIAPGPLTTVQDRGRFGYGRFGVPPSGAVDGLSLRVGNLLVGNAEGDAGLEITLYGFKARALCELLIAVTGANLQPRLGDRPLPMWQSVRMNKGEVLSFTAPRSGLRAYLSLGGGISLPPVMESRSTNLSSRFGGLDGRALKKGDILPAAAPRTRLNQRERSFDPAVIQPAMEAQPIPLRVIEGPQDQDFPREAVEQFLTSSYQATGQSDRTGIRLEGPPLAAKPGLEASIISEGVISGTVQVPGDGRPIIILGETVTGGYRKMATVISADLFRLGQIKPGDAVRFRGVSAEQALTAHRELETTIGTLRNSPRS